MLVFFFLFTGYHFEILFHFAAKNNKKQPEIIILPAPFCSSATSADRFYRIDKAQVESPLRSSSVQPSGINKYNFGGLHLDLPCFLCAFMWACAFCVFAGAPALCDGDLSGRGLHPGSRGAAGEPGPVHRDARPGGGTGIRVSRQSTQFTEDTAQCTVGVYYYYYYYYLFKQEQLNVNVKQVLMLCSMILLGKIFWKYNM